MNQRLVQIDDELIQIGKRTRETQQTLDAGREYWRRELRKTPVRNALDKSTKLEPARAR